MKKNHFIARKGLFSLALAAVGAMFLGSCAVDGFDDKEKFDNGVSGVKLESPELAVKTVVASDGSDKLQVSWKVVYGAGGYECKAYKVDDPTNPEVIVDTIMDGTSFQFKLAEDTKYKLSVRTLGNVKQNNTEADQATEMPYSTLVPATPIPAERDIAAFIKENLQNSDKEQAFELKAGATYTCNDEVDFQGNKMTLRGDKLNHALVIMGENGVIRTSAQLKVKYLNFDCTAVTNKGGIVEMSTTPPASCSAEAQGIAAGKNKNLPADVFVLQDPIILQECAFKNVPSCLFHIGHCAWGLADIRIDNCVVQLDNDGSKFSNGAVISFYGDTKKDFASPSGGQFWACSAQKISVKNSTIYNIKENSKNYFVRFANKDIDRIFPTASGSFSLENCTLSKVMTGKDFANNMPQQKKYVINVNNNVFYDTWRIQKLNKGGCTVNCDMTTNAIQGVTKPVDGTDLKSWATEEPIGFDDAACLKELDLSQPDFGLNFKATGAISSTVGDPRWRK